MIKSNELMTGNYITREGVENHLENYLTVGAIDNETITTKYWSEDSKCWQMVRFKSGYIGILLTEEWLKEFGFEIKYIDEKTNSKIWCNIEGNRIIDIYYEKQMLSYAFMINRVQYSAPINYVHQLQNLYFALTLKELTLLKK